MLRIIAGIVLVVLLLAGVVVGRTLMVPSYQDSTAAATVSKFDAAAVAARLGEAVRFRTISWQAGTDPADVAASQAAFVAFREWIATTYPQFSKTATREIVSDYSLLFTWAGSDASLKPVLLMSHLDVVPVAPAVRGIGNTRRSRAKSPTAMCGAAAPWTPRAASSACWRRRKR